MTKPAGANVFSIAPGVPFLATLVQAVRGGALGLGPVDPGDPLALADTTIFVPTRRAARALRSLFAETSATGSAILPTIRPLGEFDEDEGFFSEAMPETLALAPAISEDDRLLALARLAQAWQNGLEAKSHPLIGDEPVLLPRSAADALWLARDLASVIDDLEREGIAFDKLKEIDPANLPLWWQITKEFLEIVTEFFPAHLAEKNLSGRFSHRNALIRAEAARLKGAPAKGAFIAAGSTGSIPATAELLRVIAAMPNGAVILPGLDFHLDEASWNMIGDSEKAPSTFGHPQYGLKKLLDRFGVLRRDVRQLSDGAMLPRDNLVSQALRPAETTELWGGKFRLPGGAAIESALSGIALIEAPTERDEALAIAIALRNAIGGARAQSAALVTGDRNLARRVCAELLRFGIVADDSGGAPLSNAPQATLFQLVLNTAFEPGDALALLALLKHPLASFGEEKLKVARAAQALELIALRGTIGRVNAEHVSLHFEKAVQDASDAKRAPFWQERLKPDEIGDARLLAAALSDMIAPLCALRDALTPLTVPFATRACLEVFERIGSDESDSLAVLYAGESGEQFAAHLRALLCAEEDFTFRPQDWPSVHAALVSGKMVKPKSGSDPNVFIWGALEARLQEVDLLVLGGLNENTWPARQKDDPFLSRGMKAQMSLEPPEFRVGQAAHDFMMGLGAKNVVLSRSTRSEGTPTIASRWLQRLTALIGDDHSKALRHRGGQYLDWAGRLDMLPDVPLESRPSPSPPIELRPKHFSVTEIKTLRHDPYSIHAKRVLKLKPLDPLIRDPDDRERGNLFHDILGAFVLEEMDLTDTGAAAAKLANIAGAQFAERQLPPDIEALWWPRFEELIPAIIQIEQHRRSEVKKSFVETSSQKVKIGDTGVTLAGRADRIDLRLNGLIEIIDYKTGAKPSNADAGQLRDPQLALEAALAMRGGFSEVDAIAVNDLLYYRLKTKGEAETESVLPKDVPADALADKAWRELERLIRHFADAGAQYVSHRIPLPGKEGDYDHLARLNEWSAGEEDGGPAEE